MEPYINDGGGGGGSGSLHTGERVATELPGLVPYIPPPPRSNATTSNAAIHAEIREECDSQAWMNTRAREHDTASVSDVVIQIEDDDEVLNETQNQGKRSTAKSRKWSALAWVKRKFTRNTSDPPTSPHDGSATEVPRIFWIRENVGGTSNGESRGDGERWADQKNNADWVPITFNSNETLRLDEEEFKRNGDNRLPTAQAKRHASVESEVSESNPGPSGGALPMDTSEIFRRKPENSFFDTFTNKNIQRRIQCLGIVNQTIRGESIAEREDHFSAPEMPTTADLEISQNHNEQRDLADAPALRAEWKYGEAKPTVVDNCSSDSVIGHVTYSSSNTIWMEGGPPGRIRTFGEGINMLLLSSNETLTDASTLHNTFIIRRDGQCQQQQIRILQSGGPTSVAGRENDSGVGASQDWGQGQGVVAAAETDCSSPLKVGDVSIQIEDEDPDSSEFSDSPIKQYMDALYYLCVSPFKFHDDNSSWSLVHKVLYGVMTLVSTIYGLQLVKDQILLADRDKQKLGFYVFLAYYVNGLLFPLYFKYLAHRKPGVFKDIMRPRTKGWKRLTKVILVFSIGSCIATAAYQPVSRMNYVFEDWDVEDMIYLYSQQTSYSAFIWNASNVTNAQAALKQRYGYGSEELTPHIVGMGVSGIIIHVVGTFSLNVIRDIPLYCAFTLLLFVIDFVSVLREAYGGNVVNLLPIIWRKYNRLRDFSLKLKRLNVLFQFLHLDNVLFLSYSLFDRLILGENKTALIYDICRGMKSLMFYILSAKDACVNPIFRRWIQTTSRHTNVVFNEDAIPISGATLIEEITTDPIGVGSNMWFVDQSFVWKFFSYVGSSFFFFVESHDDNDEDD